MDGKTGMNAAISMGLVALFGAVGVLVLIGWSRRATQMHREPRPASAPSATPLRAPPPPSLHARAIDATASEFDDIRGPRFTPVISLTKMQKRTLHASAKSS
jgi:hypothetical protein